jgi:LPXTG-site transpeptidase (sortase) family protein
VRGRSSPSAGTRTESEPLFRINTPAVEPARLLAGLALAAVLTGCGSDSPETGTASPAVTSQPTVSAPTTTPDAQATAPQAHGTPSALRIPRLGIRAPVVPIKAQDRVLDPPKNPSEVGWWSEGAAPGDDVGSAVVVGHTVSTGGGVFDDVDALRPGDMVEVDNGAGTLSYRIDSVKVLSKDDLARQAETLFDQSVDGRLVLVTCEDWDGKVYRSNVVAVALPS